MTIFHAAVKGKKVVAKYLGVTATLRQAQGEWSGFPLYLFKESLREAGDAATLKQEVSKL